MKPPKYFVIPGLAAIAILALNLQPSSGFAQGTAFTYQGVLQDGGTPANGLYDLEFRAFNALLGGAQQGVTVTAENVLVTNGLFTTTLDFGAAVFTGTARWLNVAVRPGASAGSYVDLLPRHPITPSPYAVFAGGAAAAGMTGTLPSGALSGAYSGSVNLSNAANSFAGNGSRLTALNATNLTSGTVADTRLSENVALRNTANTFNGAQLITNGNLGIGTPNPTALLQVRPKPIDSGVFMAETSAAALLKSANHNGGDTPALPESVLILAREGVTLQAFANYARFDLSRFADVASESRSQLDIRLSHGRLDSGEMNDTPTIMSLRSSGNVGIGTTTPTTKLQVSGGDVTFDGNLYFGSQTRQMLNLWGQEYTAGVQPFTLYQRTGNRFSWFRGGVHVESENDPGAGGSVLMTLNPNGLVVSGSVLANGLSLPGNFGPDANFVGTPGNYIGFGHGGVSEDFIGYKNNTFFLRDSPGGGDTAQPNLDVGGTVIASAVLVNGEVTTTAVNLVSDRNAKEEFKPVNVRDVLDKVVRLPITEWNYKSQRDARHIGPMAQDFHAAFRTGHDDRHIASVDADGVALAAIQGLNEKLEETRAENTALRQTVEELKQLVSKLAGPQNGGAR